MSDVSAAFSSSSFSMRSMNDRKRSPAMRRVSAMLRRAVLVSGGEGRPLLRRRRRLVFRLPRVVRHAIDDLARLRLGEREAALLGRRPVPFRQAVAAEAGAGPPGDV